MFTADDYQKLLRGRDPLYTPDWMNALADHLVYIEADIARKKALIDALVAECIRDKAEITRLEAVNAELVEALVDLMDCQNGPPLVTWTARWNAAMVRCGEAAALAKASAASPQPRAADASTPPES